MQKKSLRGKEYWDKLLLKDNPFRPTPPSLARPIIWAGRNELKKELEETITTSLTTSPSRLILNWGHYGAGKTHAARYFTNPYVLEEFCKTLNVSKPCALDITLPRPARTGELLRVLYLDLLSAIKFETLQDAVSKVYKQLQLTKSTKETLYSLTGSEDFVKIFERLASTKKGSERELVRRYVFLGTMSSAELRSLEVVRKIESFSDIKKMTSAVINLFTLSDKRCPEPAYSEVFLWIDENEALGDLSGRDHLMYTSFIRDVLDDVPGNLTIFLNLTLSPGETFADIEGYLTTAVWDRIEKNISFAEMVDAESVTKYVRDLMNHEIYRPSEFKIELKEKKLDEYYPFTLNALKHIVDLAKSLTPRRVNEICTRALELGRQKGEIKDVGDRITEEFIEKYANEIFRPAKEKSS